MNFNERNTEAFVTACRVLLPHLKVKKSKLSWTNRPTFLERGARLIFSTELLLPSRSDWMPKLSPADQEILDGIMEGLEI